MRPRRLGSKNILGAASLLRLFVSVVVCAIYNLIAWYTGLYIFSLLSIAPFIFFAICLWNEKKKHTKHRKKDNHSPDPFYGYLAGIIYAALLIAGLRTDSVFLSYACYALSIIPFLYIVMFFVACVMK